LIPESGRTVPVSVVVCVRNRAGVISRCLRSVEQGRPAEVIVVDGGSTDGTADIARRFGARVLDDGGRGLGAARQLGAESAVSDFLVFVDSDTVIAPTTLEDLYGEAVEGGYDGLQARLATLNRPPSYWQWAEDRRRRENELPGPAAAIGCQATLMRRKVVLQTRFDPVFRGAAEDGDFCFRASAGGAKWGHAFRAHAFHDDRASLIAFFLQRIWHGRGLARQILRHRARYASGAKLQAAGARSTVARDLRLVPFYAVSTFGLAIGLALEGLSLALQPTVLRSLRDSKL
jgi:glycosyltransferase involved in cell wall biosynthesis